MGGVGCPVINKKKRNFGLGNTKEVTKFGKIGVFSRKNVERRSSSLEAVLSLDDEEFDGEAELDGRFNVF